MARAKKSQPDSMFYGILGEAVQKMEPHTESDPNGMMLVLLSEFGNAVGNGPHIVADGSRHAARINVLLVGASGNGRKGTIQGNIDRLMEQADPDWFYEAQASGLSTGEGLISAIQTPAQSVTQSASGSGLTISAPTTKRALFVESEFARSLKVAKRESNTISAVVRQAFDSTRLSIMTKTPVKGEGHISIIGHITPDELHKTMDAVEVANGFMNRFLFASVQRSKLLPEGGDSEPVIEEYAPKIKEAIDAAQQIERMSKTPAATKLWARLYSKWAENNSDLAARAPAYVLRVAMVFALADGARQISPDHLTAANAVWEYNLRSIGSIFEGLGGNLGKLARALEDAHPRWLNTREVSAVFSNNLKKRELDELKEQLEEMGLMEEIQEARKGPGRPAKLVRWVAKD